MGDAQNIAWPDGFRFVGERGNAPVDFRKFGIAWCESEVAQITAQCVSSRVLSHDQRTRRYAYRFRRNDFIGQRIFDNAVLVDSSFVSERIRADDCLIRSDDSARDFCEQPACREKLIEFDAGGDAETVFANRQPHRDFFERSVAGALADSVDGTFDLANTSSYCGQGIGDSKPEIIVAVRTQSTSLPVAQDFANASEHFAIFLRHGIT